MNKTAAAFGYILKKARAARGMSQAKLSQASKLDRSYISMMERGIRQPSLSTIFDLSRALKMHPADLVGLTERRARTANRQISLRHRL